MRTINQVPRVHSAKLFSPKLNKVNRFNVCVLSCVGSDTTKSSVSAVCVRDIYFPKRVSASLVKLLFMGPFFWEEGCNHSIVSPIPPGSLGFLIKICGDAKSVVYRQLD